MPQKPAGFECHLVQQGCGIAVGGSNSAQANAANVGALIKQLFTGCVGADCVGSFENHRVLPTLIQSCRPLRHLFLLRVWQGCFKFFRGACTKMSSVLQHGTFEVAGLGVFEWLSTLWGPKSPSANQSLGCLTREMFLVSTATATRPPAAHPRKGTD